MIPKVVVFVTGYLALVVTLSVLYHEGLHLIFARYWTADIHFTITRCQPNIQVNSPYDITDAGVVLFGAAPYIGGIILVWLSLVFLPGNLLDGMIFALDGLGTTVGLSGGDLLAVFDPSTFKEYAATTDSDVPGIREAFQLIRED